MTQQNLLPEPIRLVVPSQGTSSVDSIGIGRAYSGQSYQLKQGAPGHPFLPGSEWICHGLAQLMHLAVPHWTVCVLPDGREVFGSRFEGAVKEAHYIPTARPATANPDVVSRTYVVDLFLGNNDRHIGNWLLTETGGVDVLRPIDFSRALLFRYPPLPTPAFDPGDNSSTFYEWSQRFGAMLPDESGEAHAQLAALPKAAWRGIVESVPPGWLPSALARELSNWWWSPQWSTRIKWMEQQL